MTHGESRPADGERDMTQTFSAGPTASFSVRPYKYSPIAAFSGRLKCKGNPLGWFSDYHSDC